MGLIKKTADRAATPIPEKGSTLSGKAAEGKFEKEPETVDNTVVEERQPAAAASPTASAAPSPAASENRAVAAAPARSVATQRSLELMDVVRNCKNAYTVDWDTLDRVQANTGKFLDLGKSKLSMGEVIQLQLLSWQDNWQISPGVKGDEAAEHVRYSNDGITTTKGEDCAEYLQKLRTIYKDAKMTQRVVLVGVLEGSEKDSRLEGQMIQLDLSNSSKKEFDKYQLNTAFKVGKGLLTADQALLVTMRAVTASANGNDWTKVEFEPTLLQGAKAA